ncbi:hypothetical protein EV360DRAFT_81213 [Lentinula raphanica]|nr:hypothetical protein EV360DRAFT_81213 [Lentinula raphanica]
MAPSLNSQVQATLSSVRPYFVDSGSRYTRRSSSSSMFPFELQIARHHPSALILDPLLRELKAHVREGRLVTFSKEKLAWDKWREPFRALVSGALTTISPPSYEGIPGYKGPVCPHILNPFLSIEDCTMVVKVSRSRGVNRYTFLAPHPGCEFQMNIPYYGRQRIEAELQGSDSEDGEETDQMYSSFLSFSSSQSSSASIEEVESSLVRGVHTSSGSSASFPGHLSSNSSSGSSSLFTPQGTSTPLQPIEGRPDNTVVDRDLVVDITLAFNRGIFRDFPRFHPAYSLESQSLGVLAAYHHSNNNGELTYDNMQFFDSTVGRLIRDVNTTLGAKPASFKYLISLSCTCAVCLCEYSPDGFAAHNENGEGSPRCRNTPGFPAVPDRRAIEVDETRLIRRTFLDGQHPAFRDDSDSALGRPWLEWNSALGIPADVWAVIKTGVVVCQTCHLVRTFNADRIHRASDGSCMDLGQEEEEIIFETDTLEAGDPLAPSKGKQVA